MCILPRNLITVLFPLPRIYAGSLIVILFAIFGANLPARTADNFDEPWRWSHFTTESGLPSDRIQELYEGTSGTVWVATTNGLAWFDDFQWILIDSTLGIPVNRPVNIIGEIGDSLVIVSNREYYIGTKNGFHSLEIGPSAGAVILNGDRLLFLQRTVLYQYSRGAIQVFQPGLSLTPGRIIAMAKTQTGGVWLNLIDGLYKWQDGGFQLKIPAGANPLGNPLVVENRRGTGLLSLEIPFEKRGLWEWTANSLPARNLAERADIMRTMAINDDGEVIAIYPSDDVRVRRDGKWSVVTFNHPLIRDILTLAFRRNGDLWVGTQHGLFLYKRSSSRWTYWNHPPPDLRNSVNELLRTQNGDMWIGTSDGIEIHRSDGRSDFISSINGVQLYVVTGLAEDATGNVWVSSGASFPGAFRWNGVRWDHFSVSDDSGGVRFHKIRLDQKGRLWFLGLGKLFPPFGENQPGAYVLDHGRFERWGEQEGLISGRVYSFASGTDGTLWFGTFDGLSRWKKGVWTHWSSHRGLHDGRVFTLALDRQNHPWFGDYDERSGLATIDENDSVRYLTTANGLVSDKIWDIKSDSQGKMWISTRAGLCSYDNGTWSAFDEKSGLHHVGLWPVLPFEQNVYVGTMGKGVAILHREESSTPAPRITTDKPLMDGKNIVLRWKTFAYWGELSPGEIFTRIRINEGMWSPWQKVHEVTLSDLHAGNYTYQLQAKGLFGSVGAEGFRGSFVIPLPLHLRPMFLIPVSVLAVMVIGLGISLLVRKRNHDLEIRKSEEKFRIVTEMTASAIFIFQRTKILFVNTAAELLTGWTKEELLSMDLTECIYPSDRELTRERELVRSGTTSVPQRYECRIASKSGSIRWVDFTSGWIRFQGAPVRLGTALDITERKFAEEKLRLLASELSTTEERERRRLATYLHDTIGQTLAFSKMKIRLLQRSLSPDEMNDRLQEIRELVDQAITDTRSLTYELSPPILYELDFVAALEWLTNHISQKHRLDVTLEDDKRPKVLDEELRVFLFHAVREILINVVKHAEARCVKVTLAGTDTQLDCTIQDDGIGFDVRTKSPVADMDGGFGLFNIRERLQQLGGRMEITSSSSSGTRVTISLPLKPSVTPLTH